MSHIRKANVVRGRVSDEPSFKVGDRVELLLFYSFHDDPLPKGTVVGVSAKCVRAKMDSNTLARSAL